MRAKGDLGTRVAFLGGAGRGRGAAWGVGRRVGTRDRIKSKGREEKGVRLQNKQQNKGQLEVPWTEKGKNQGRQVLVAVCGTLLRNFFSLCCSFAQNRAQRHDAKRRPITLFLSETLSPLLSLLPPLGYVRPRARTHPHPHATHGPAVPPCALCPEQGLAEASLCIAKSKEKFLATRLRPSPSPAPPPTPTHVHCAPPAPPRPVPLPLWVHAEGGSGRLSSPAAPLLHWARSWTATPVRFLRSHAQPGFQAPPPPHPRPPLAAPRQETHLGHTARCPIHGDGQACGGLPSLPSLPSFKRSSLPRASLTTTPDPPPHPFLFTPLTPHPLTPFHPTA